MFRTVLALTLALSGEPAAARLDDPAVAAVPKNFEELRTRFGAAIDAERFEEALVLAKAIADHRDFAGQPEAYRRAINVLQGLLNAQLGRSQTALPFLRVEAARPDSTPGVWMALIEAEARTDDWTGAARSLTAFLPRFPDARADLSVPFVTQVARSPEADKDARFDLRWALYRSGWRDEGASWTWVSLVDYLMARDRLDDAVRVAGLVTSPYAQLQFRALRRYDPLTARLGGDFDLAAALDQTFERDRTAATAADATIAQRNTYAGDLYARARYAEALAVSDEALAEPETGETASDRTWAMDTRARVLMALDRPDEAAVQQEAAAARKEGDARNISQAINLGWMYLRLDRNADALAVVKDMDGEDVSPYGRMQAIQVRACAAHALGDVATEQASTAWLKTHWRDAPGAWRDALACQGDVDGLAALMIEQLADPDLAPGAVSGMHSYLPEPGVTAFDRRLIAVRQQALARPDVIAARDAVGRALVVPTLGDQF